MPSYSNPYDEIRESYVKLTDYVRDSLMSSTELKLSLRALSEVSIPQFSDSFKELSFPYANLGKIASESVYSAQAAYLDDIAKQFSSITQLSEISREMSLIVKDICRDTADLSILSADDVAAELRALSELALDFGQESRVETSEPEPEDAEVAEPQEKTKEQIQNHLTDSHWDDIRDNLAFVLAVLQFLIQLYVTFVQTSTPSGTDAFTDDPHSGFHELVDPPVRPSNLAAPQSEQDEGKEPQNA